MLNLKSWDTRWRLIFSGIYFVMVRNSEEAIRSILFPLAFEIFFNDRQSCPFSVSCCLYIHQSYEFVANTIHLLQLGALNKCGVNSKRCHLSCDLFAKLEDDLLVNVTHYRNYTVQNCQSISVYSALVYATLTVVNLWEHCFDFKTRSRSAVLCAEEWPRPYFLRMQMPTFITPYQELW